MIAKVNKKSKGITSKAQSKAENIILPPLKNDPNGSYTGKPINGGKPVQDADDL